MQYRTSSSKERRDHARGQSCNTAIACVARAVDQRVGHQPEDRCEVAQARDGRRCENRADGAAVDGADQGLRSDGSRGPAPHLLRFDDCLYARQPSIPHLTRSALHRCLQRPGISRLPDVEGDKPKCQRLKRYEPRRVCRRLQLLSWMEHHEQDNEQVFPRSA